MQFAAVFPHKNSYQKGYKKEASNGKKGQWNFHFRSARRRFCWNFAWPELRKVSKQRSSNPCLREPQTWFEQLRIFSNFRSKTFKETQNPLSPNDKRFTEGNPIDWILELLDLAESSARFRPSVRWAIQPLRWILETTNHILFKHWTDC